ncbi:MAG: helix-turn-helix domain-containing protein [Candidatus Syntrophonatronum acetioxidans]|uniref:Helix-turn-helix domain-containing protein n=1 Tax=Candidatus Syntrophonatronum acetioxidans TaxID=1795816 RepID=A0A424YEU7_9FIRM|nr:MAG: helix-turn-helix domain-containing protein [Candidatus Syntrophonatronum acetioxidans]
MLKGDHIRKLRCERNYSLKELAQKAGISVSYLSEIERDRKKPSLKTLEKISEALNVSTREFINRGKSQEIVLGERIRAYREEKGLSLKELSKLADISYSYLCEIEKGAVNPSISTLRKVAQSLEVSPKSLLSPLNSLGNKLTNLREEQELNQAQLAKKTGLSPGLIGQIEKGKAQPSLQTLEKIARVLKVSPCFFIVEEESLQETLGMLRPEIRALLMEPEILSTLKMLRQCSEKEFRLIMDFIKLIKRSDLDNNG